MKIRLNQVVKICTMLILSVVSFASFAQTSIIGTVTDSKDGSPVSGATVIVKGTKIATKTNASGTFNLNAPSTGTLVISSVNYGTEQITIDGQTSYSVKMTPTNKQLEDVVVIAYGTSRKKDLVGAVNSISAKDFQKGSINSSEQLLQGKVAGLQVTSGGGSAGGGSKIRLRGESSLNASNDPLIVIDDVPVDNNNAPGSANLLNTINPNDIESISVLKDVASTVLYGARATNGVIIITTKKGTSGKTRFSFNTQFTVGQVSNYVKVLNGDEVRSIVNADAVTTGSNVYKNQLGTANTDWQKAIYQKAIGTENNLSASGTFRPAKGSFKLPFRGSIGYLKQTGVLKTNSFDRVTSSLNLTPKFLKDNLAITVATKYTFTSNRFANEGAVGSALSFDPTQAIYSGKSRYYGLTEYLDVDGRPNRLAPRNPVGLLENKFSFGNTSRLLASLKADYKLPFFPDLHVILNVGVDDTRGYGNNYTDSSSAEGAFDKGRNDTYKGKKVNTLLEQSLFYSKELKSIKSKIDVLALHSYQDFRNRNEFFDVYRGIGNLPTLFPFDIPQYRLDAYLGRVNFSYNNKYFITGSIRRDESSKFSPKDRVIVSPSVGVAWKLKEEFFKNTNVVSELKLRGSWGRIGNQDGINNYAYLSRYGLSTLTAQYQFGNTFYQLTRPSAYDENLKWETVESYNVGLDFGFLNNRISGSVDAYQKKTSNLLSNVPAASGANYDVSILTNVGSLENKGIEATLNLIPVRNKNITWELGVNGSFNQSKITNLLLYDDPNFKGVPVNGISGGLGRTISRHAIGYAPYTFYTFKQVYDAGGKPIQGLYEDINRDGIVNDLDLVYNKHPNPDFLFGINTSFTYKKWNVSAAAHGALGNYLYNNFKMGSGALTSVKNQSGFVTNANASYNDTKFTISQFSSDYYLENASYLRMDNINLGYDFGRVGKTKAILRLAASVQNVFIITKYSGIDPESASNGVDNNIYPRPRIFSFRANIDF